MAYRNVIPLDETIKTRSLFLKLEFVFAATSPSCFDSIFSVNSDEGPLPVGLRFGIVPVQPRKQEDQRYRAIWKWSIYACARYTNDSVPKYYLMNIYYLQIDEELGTRTPATAMRRSRFYPREFEGCQIFAFFLLELQTLLRKRSFTLRASLKALTVFCTMIDLY